VYCVAVLKEGEVQWDKTTGLDVDLPEEERFSEFDFSTDQSEDVSQASCSTPAGKRTGRNGLHPCQP
jgi:hypothetical protein